MWVLYRALKGIPEEIALEEARTIGLQSDSEAEIRTWQQYGHQRSKERSRHVPFRAIDRRGVERAGQRDEQPRTAMPSHDHVRPAASTRGRPRPTPTTPPPLPRSYESRLH